MPCSWGYRCVLGGTSLSIIGFSFEKSWLGRLRQLQHASHRWFNAIILKQLKHEGQTFFCKTYDVSSSDPVGSCQTQSQRTMACLVGGHMIPAIGSPKGLSSNQ